MLGATSFVRIVRYERDGPRDAEGEPTLAAFSSKEYPANIYERSSQQHIDGQVFYIQQWWARLPADAPVRTSDELHDAAGDRWQVRSATVRRGWDGRPAHIACHIERVS